MKPPILIGLAVAVLIVVGSLFAPLLRDSDLKRAERALEQATLAQRELARHSLNLPRADVRASPGEMTVKEEDLGAAVAAAQETLQATGAEFGKHARTAQELAQRYNLPAAPPPPFGTDVVGVQRALAAFQSAVKENQELLGRALKNASAAAAIDAEALGVQQTIGMAEYVRAADLLAQARDLRVRQAEAQAQLLDVASRWKVAQGLLEHYRGLDAAPVVAELRADQEELADRRAQAADNVADLSARVTAADQAYAQLEQALAEQQRQLLALREQGFLVGQDEGAEGFDAYRQQYLTLSERLRELQQQEQEARYGGRRGAEATSGDWAAGELQGGEATVGLEELRRRLEVAQARLRCLEEASAALDAHIGHVNASGGQADVEAARYGERMSELSARAQAAAAEVERLAGEAFEKETEALRAAENAVRAFAQSQRATDAWLRAVRDLQRERDASRRNRRLDILLRDPYLEHVPRSAEASARVLAGRIHLQRVENGEALLGDMRVFTETYADPHLSFDPSPYEAQVEAARTAGLETVQKAAEIYAGVAEKLASVPTVWVPLGAGAAAHHLLSCIDPVQAGVHASRAAELIQRAVERREQFPYAQPLVAFRGHLAGVVRGVPGEARPEGEAPPPVEEESDFFTDDD